MVVFVGYGNSQRSLPSEMRLKKRAEVVAVIAPVAVTPVVGTFWKLPEKVDFEKKEEDVSDDVEQPVEQPTLLTKFMSFFGADEEEEEEETPKVLEPKKQAFFDNLFASTNLDLSADLVGEYE
jgi:hypothetical protein